MFDRIDVSLSYTVDKSKFLSVFEPKLNKFMSFSDRPNLSMDARAQLSGFSNYLEFVVQNKVYQSIRHERQTR